MLFTTILRCGRTRTCAMDTKRISSRYLMMMVFLVFKHKQALKLSISPGLLRDTARYPPLMKKKVWISMARVTCALVSGAETLIALYLVQPNSEGLRAQSLKVIANQELGLAIQDGEHSPVDDARAALYIYLKHRKARCAWARRCMPRGSSKMHTYPLIWTIFCRTGRGGLSREAAHRTPRKCCHGRS